jgi:hypothetical protein
MLDSRGYCINSKMSFEFECNFKSTLPSRHYPSASPYAALTEYLREMIREKVIKRFIVKALLYPEFLNDIDTTEVKLRKRHKTFVRMIRKENDNDEEENSECDDDEEDEEDEDTVKIERQNAIEYESDRSHIYSNVKYNKVGRKDSWDDEGTIYESFIDHGEGAGEIYYQRLHDNSADSSLCFVTECESRESFMIGSKPIRYVEDITKKKRKESDDNIIHLTTAKMNLLDIKQKSEQSQTSSFEHKLSGGWKNMACENLHNIDDSIELCQASPQKPFAERHHSMPVQFVGNRFNENSLTEIYIPSCDNAKNLPTPHNSVDDDGNNEQKKSHSSSVHVQETQEMKIEVDDLIKNEILYNLEKFQELPTFEPTSTISQPPNYSSDSDSGMAGSYTLSPSDNYHRSYNSHKFNMSIRPSWTLRSSIRPESVAEFSPIPTLKQQESIEGENRAKVLITFEHNNKTMEKPKVDKKEKTFYSGMYAHWWKKEDLPAEMMKSLLNCFIDDHDGERQNEGEGSGKKKIQRKICLESTLMMLHTYIVRGVTFFNYDFT